MPSLNNKKILVFGGAGFIGSNFIRMVAQRYPKAKIVNFDKLTYSGNPDHIKDHRKHKYYSFKKADIADEKAVEAIFKKERPNYVINFAAETHVDRSIHVGAKEFLLTNIHGVFNILEAIKKTGKDVRYVQVSTDEVYGSLELGSNERFTVEHRFAPSVPYASTKAAGDLLCHTYFKTWGIPAIVTHCTNNYGPYQYPEKLIPYFVVRMLENKKLPLYGDGKNVRDWIYVIDHCEALLMCLLEGKAGETYNIGADNEISNVTIAKHILRHFNRDESWLDFVSDRPGHDRRYAIDSSKIRRELGWKPKHTFDRAFKETVTWYIANKDWIERVRKRTGVFNPHIDLWKGHSKKNKRK